MRALSESYYHAGGAVPLSGLTIPQHFAAIVARFPDREAVVSRHQGRRLSYAGLAAAIDTLARGLIGIGLGRGDRIGIWSTNNVEWLLVQMAAARIGAVLVCINPAYRTEELRHALRRSELHALFVIPAFRSSDYVAMLRELVPQLETDRKPLECGDFPHLRRVILFDPADPAATRPPYPGLTAWGRLLEAAAAVPAARLDGLSAALDRDDPVGLLYTSGTFGFPKTAVLSHHNLLNNALASAAIMRFDERDRLCVPVPFYHCFGMVLAALLGLCAGGCLVLPGEYFDPLAVLEAVRDERCTALHGAARRSDHVHRRTGAPPLRFF
jgi:fatty-acyl-CoA synthase